MPQTRVSPVLRHIRRLAGTPHIPEPTDAELVRRFVTNREDDAFALLMRRHGGLVMGVCRRVLPRVQDAEDAFQATFLTLVRHAASIRRDQAVGSWLYRVAYRIALRAGKDMARRSTLEKKAMTANTSAPASEAALQELQAVVDQELQRLPEKYRAPFVLCCLEGKSRSEAARELGWKEGTVAGRVAEARKLLQTRLAKRGVALSAALTVVSLAEGASAALAGATLRAAAALAAGKALAGAVSDKVVALVEGGFGSLSAVKIKAAVAVLLLLGAVVAAGAYSHAAPPAEPAKPAAKPTAEDKDVVTRAGVVLGPDGKPFAGAKVYLLLPARKPRGDVRATSGADGTFRFAVPRAEREELSNVAPAVDALAAVVARAEGYGLGRARREDGGEELTLRLTRDDVPIQGRVIDLEGKPIAGATVRVAQVSEPRHGDVAPFFEGVKARKNLNEVFGEQLVRVGGWRGASVLFPPLTTGADGRFRLNGVGRERLALLRVEGSNLETVSLYVATRPMETVAVRDRGRRRRDDVAALHGATFVHAAAPARPVVGTVRDKDTGRPIPGAIVRASTDVSVLDFPTDFPVVADKEGRYRFNGLSPTRAHLLRAEPPDGEPYHTALESVDPATDGTLATVDFALKRGVWITGRVFDTTTGKPARAQVRYHVFKDNPHLKDVPGGVGGDFLFVNPEDGTFRLVGLPGRAVVAAHGLEGRHVIGLGAEAIKDNTDKFNLEYYHRVVEVNPAPGAASVTCDLALGRGRTLAGRLVGPDGKSVAGARANGLASHWAFGVWDNKSLPDADFTVEGLVAGRERRVLLLHEAKKLAGSFRVRDDEKGPVTVTLEPWGTLTGRLVTDDGEPRPGVELSFAANRDDLDVGTLPHDLTPRTDKDGRFRIAGLIPGMKYTLLAWNKGGALDLGCEVIKGKSGEMKDLGDVKVKKDE